MASESASAPASVGDQLEVTAERAVAGGSVLARSPDGPVLLLDGALPGERVRVEITARRRNHASATVVDVVDASPHRMAPPCPFVEQGCGGCDLQHADGDAQLAMKREIVVDALRRLGRVDGADGVVRTGRPLPAIGFRTSVRGAVDDDGRFAFRRRRAHDTVRPARCLVAHPSLDELIADGHFGTATEVTLRVGAGTGERLAILTPGVDDGVRLPDDVAVVGLDELRAGRRVWFHESVRDRTFRVSARSFFQSRADGADALVDEILAAAEGTDGPAVDAYCGVGLFASFLADADRPVLGVERSRSSMADARVNLAGTDATLVTVDVDRWRPSPAELVVADPARQGLGARAVERLAGTRAGRLVLVSCDAAALGRDTALLTDRGYALASATIVDLFPHTHHVEVVSRFDASRR